MNFTIKGPTVHVPEKISIRKPLLIVGSCFAENIGNIMQQQLFDVQVNPFGIAYNPLSIASQLQMIVTRKEFAQSDLFQHNELWHSWHHHGSFSNAHTTSVLAAINKEIHDAHRQLLKADWLVITLGTAFYYTLPNQIIVSNCHKVPASQFNKKIATQAQITNALQEAFEHIKSEHKIIVTTEKDAARLMLLNDKIQEYQLPFFAQAIGIQILFFYLEY